MPIINIDCSKCGIIETVENCRWCGDNKLGYPCKCPECGNDAVRIMENSVNQDCGEHVRLSRALGVHPDLIESGEAFKIHPGANFVKTDGGMYALEIKGRGEKLRRMAERSKYTGMALNEDD